MAAMEASGQIDIPRLREVVADWWDHPGLMRAPAPRQYTTAGQQPQQQAQARAGTPRPPVLGVKPAAGLLDDDRLPPALREMAKRMGGVPSWWSGTTGGGEVALPDGAKQVGKLPRKGGAGSG